MKTEALYADGSHSEWFGDGGAFHTGPLAMERLRLITAKSALIMYIRSEGKMQLTRNGVQNAIHNVIEPLTGKTYKRSMNGKREALADCVALLEQIEREAVVYREDGDV